MLLRRLPLLLVLAFALGAPVSLVSGEAQAATKKSAVRKPAKKAAKARKAKRPRGKLVCRGKGKKRKCRRVVPTFSGHRVAQSSLRTEPLPRPSGDIHIYSTNFREELRVNIYGPDGSFDDAALAKLDHMFRCRRTKEVRAVDPRLYEILSIISDHFGGKRIELLSGFRYQRGEGSRHFHGAAMDIKVLGVSYRELYQFAETLDLGGMGIGKYPRADFVHIDFRAPGEPSYRWTDTSGRGSGARNRRPSVMWRRKPNT